MTYRDLDKPVRKVLTSKVSGTIEFEIFGAMYDNGTPKVYLAKSQKNGIDVYDEFTPIEVGQI